MVKAKKQELIGYCRESSKWTPLPRPEFSFADDKNQAKKVRSGFFMRMCATSIDITCGVLIASVVQRIVPNSGMMATQIGIVIYYLGIELIAGQTIGKVLLGMELVSIKGDLTASKIVFRNVLRMLVIMTATVIPCGFLLLCTWRRTSLLDLMTGTRVIRHCRGKKQNPVGFDPELLVR